MSLSSKELADLSEALVSIATALAFVPYDTSAHHRDAWIYGVLLGWGETLDEVAKMHNWNEETRGRLIRYRRIIEKVQRGL